MRLCDLFVITNVYACTCGDRQLVQTSKQVRKQASVTSAIDKSIDNNDNAKTARDYFRSLTLEITRL